MIGNKKRPMDYLIDMQNQDQKSIFETSPARLTKNPQSIPGSSPSPKPTVQTQAPRDYYIHPVTGESTGMTFDAYYDQWSQSYAGQHFGGDYDAYLEFLNTPGNVNPIVTDPFGTGSANQNAPWGGEGTAPGQGMINLPWNYGGATQQNWAPGEEGGLNRRGHGNPPWYEGP